MKSGANQLIKEGKSAATAEDRLIEKGLDRETGADVVDDLREVFAKSNCTPKKALLFVLPGMVLCVLGGVLIIGNGTGFLPMLTIALGIALITTAKFGRLAK